MVWKGSHSETDVIDLLQFHEIIRMSDPERIFGPEGAMAAVRAAKQAGKVRFIGFTGHKNPQIHLAMLDRAAADGFTFDAVQMPLNVMDAQHDGFQKKVLPVLVKQKIGVLAMKPLGSGLFLRSAPMATGKLTATDCLQYAMNLPVSVVITGCETVGVLYQGLDAAYRFTPRSHGWMQRTVAKASPAKGEGWEKYKFTDAFDATSQHPWWMDTGSLSK